MLVGIDETSVVWSLFLTVGVPLIVILFYFDGMVIGKVLPPGAIFVGYVTIFRPDGIVLLLVSAAAVLATTLGQWTLYRGFNDRSPEFFGIRRRIPGLKRLPLKIKGRLGPKRMAIVTSLFERFGGPALTVVNIVPGIRCLITIPAGLSRYPVRRFLLYSTIGNTIYVVLLVGIARGILEIADAIRL